MITDLEVDWDFEDENYGSTKDESEPIRVFTKDRTPIYLDLYFSDGTPYFEFITYYLEKEEVQKAYKISEDKGRKVFREIYENDVRSVIKHLPRGHEYTFTIPDGEIEEDTFSSYDL